MYDSYSPAKRGGAIESQVLAAQNIVEERSEKQAGGGKSTVASEHQSGSPDYYSQPGTSRSTNYKFTGKKRNMGQTTSSSGKLAHVELDDESCGYSEEVVDIGPKYILVGWDKFRSKLMATLLILLLMWAAAYFPLLHSGYLHQ